MSLFEPPPTAISDHTGAYVLSWSTITSPQPGPISPTHQAPTNRLAKCSTSLLLDNCSLCIPRHLKTELSEATNFPEARWTAGKCAEKYISIPNTSIMFSAPIFINYTGFQPINSLPSGQMDFRQVCINIYCKCPYLVRVRNLAYLPCREAFRR